MREFSRVPGAALGQRGSQGTSAARGHGTATAKRAPLLRAAAGSSPKPQHRALLRGRRQHNLHPPETGIYLQNDTKASPHSAAGAGAARQPAPSNCYYVQHGGRRGGHRAALHSEPLARLPPRPSGDTGVAWRTPTPTCPPPRCLRETDATRPSPQPCNAGLSLAAAHAQLGCGGGRAARPRPPPGGSEPPPPPVRAEENGGRGRGGAPSPPPPAGDGRTRPSLGGVALIKHHLFVFSVAFYLASNNPPPSQRPSPPGAYNSTARQPCRPPAPFPTAGPHPFPRAGDALLRVRPADRGTQPGRSPAKPIPDSHQPFPGTGSALSSAGNPPAQPSEQSRQQPSPGCCCAGLRRARCTPVWRATG